MDQVDKTVITSQPIRSSQHLEINLESLKEATAAVPAEIPRETNQSEIKENDNPTELTEVTAEFDSDTGHVEENEEEQCKRRKRQASDCCCVYIEDDDPFCLYLLCHWFCDCFRCIGECTDSCFEECAVCLNDCCDSSGDGGGDCCTGCCDGDDADGSADCLAACASCDCDCSD